MPSASTPKTGRATRTQTASQPTWLKKAIAQCYAAAPNSLWPYLDRKLLELLGWHAQHAPDDTPINKLVAAADEGETGVNMSDGHSTFFVHLPWMWVGNEARRDVVRWAKRIATEPPEGWTFANEQTLEQPLHRALKRLKLDADAWQSQRTGLTLAQLRAAADASA